MRILTCDITEHIYNGDNLISTNNYRRIFRIDDENNKLYLNKAPIDEIVYYSADKINFKTQTMTDDFIMMSNVVINRNDNTYSAVSNITYDNPIYGARVSKSEGKCNF